MFCSNSKLNYATRYTTHYTQSAMNLDIRLV